MVAHSTQINCSLRQKQKSKLQIWQPHNLTRRFLRVADNWFPYLKNVLTGLIHGLQQQLKRNIGHQAPLVHRAFMDLVSSFPNRAQLNKATNHLFYDKIHLFHIVPSAQMQLVHQKYIMFLICWINAQSIPNVVVSYPWDTGTSFSKNITEPHRIDSQTLVNVSGAALELPSFCFSEPQISG